MIILYYYSCFEKNNRNKKYDILSVAERYNYGGIYTCRLQTRKDMTQWFTTAAVKVA